MFAPNYIASAAETVLFQRLIDAVQDYAIYMLDPQGYVLTWNSGAERTKGYKAEEIIGKHYSVFFTPEDVASRLPERNLERARERGRFHEEAWRVKKDGSRFWAVVTLTAIHDDAGALVGYAKITRDLTAKKQQMEILRAAKEKAEQASQAKSLFLSNMSHELRTPLNSIIGFSELLQKEAFGPLGHASYREYADQILQSGQYLLHFLNNVLDLAQMDAAGIELHEEEVDVLQLIDGAILAMRTAADEKGVSIRRECDGSARLLGDPRRLHQMLVHLLSNGLKFTPADGLVTVFSAGAGAGGGLEIGVCDTGIGMSADQIPAALSPLGQVDMAIAKTSGGIGLGLPLAKKIVDLHGGELRISSAPGSGTEVVISFPEERLVRSRLSLAL